jgi:hypothetical protein
VLVALVDRSVKLSVSCHVRCRTLVDPGGKGDRASQLIGLGIRRARPHS